MSEFIHICPYCGNENHVRNEYVNMQMECCRCGKKSKATPIPGQEPAVDDPMTRTQPVVSAVNGRKTAQTQKMSPRPPITATQQIKTKITFPTRESYKLYYFAIALAVVALAALIPAGVLIQQLLTSHVQTISPEEYHLKKCGANMKKIALALHLFADGKNFPQKDNLPGLLELLEKEILTDSRDLVCPGAVANGNQARSYVFFGGHSSRDPIDTVLAFDFPGNHKNKVNVLFVDGNVKTFVLADGSSCAQILLAVYQNDVKSPLRRKQLEKAQKFDLDFHKIAKK